MSQTCKKRPKRKTAARCKVSRKLSLRPAACRRRKRRPVAQPTPPPPSPQRLNVDPGPIVLGADSLPRYELTKP